MSDNDEVLTTRQGHPVHSNHSMRTVGDRGPANLGIDHGSLDIDTLVAVR